MEVRFWMGIDGSLVLGNKFESTKRAWKILLRRTLLDCFRTPCVRVIPGLKTFIGLITIF